MCLEDVCESALVDFWRLKVVLFNTTPKKKVHTLDVILLKNGKTR